MFEGFNDLMNVNEFESIADKLGFEFVMSRSEKTDREDKALIHSKLYVQKQHSYILYARILNGVVVIATLYGQVYYNETLTENQKQALKGSGYQIIDKDKIYFGFSVTKGLSEKAKRLMFEFTPVKKWFEFDKLYPGFVDHTFEAGCGRGTGFTFEELKKSELISKIIF